MLLVFNVAVFLAQWTVFRIGSLAAIPALLSCIPAAVLKGCVWQLVTYAFLHADPLHLLFNMLFLWFLGPLVEQRIGTTAFYWVYILSALAGGVAHVVLYLLLGGSGGAFGLPMVGASGAMMAVAVICATYYFHMLVYFMGFFPVKLGVLVLILVAVDALYMIGPAAGGVARHAHLAGAAVGFLYPRVDWRWTDIWRWRLRVLMSALWPFRRRRRPRRKADVRNIFDDDYFQR